MTTSERRAKILKILQMSSQPVAGKEFAAKFGVSRQVIVQDMAVLRASTPGILSTTRGYSLQKELLCTREFKLWHPQEETSRELNLIVDCGGSVKNTSISHRVYGRVTVDMDIHSRQDVAEFIDNLKDSQSSVLSSATSGYHYHLVEAASEERLDLIEQRLREAGFLAPLKPWEMNHE
ncbi:transcriptional regulator [Mediterraneibacter butyricigenes]|jgi:transcriptional regulator of NAD metabolism|uniref:Transcriptional regulator n=1 Tax=Mediterraneibacter butyricigenes TaxID=2316025 RepID=A0A391P736_9FIRM|nr:transcription repressor NadR [Mediterraneibacter butyricigenes]RGO24251.1 transcription repressor NadR [Dorea sp. OM02-2LB]RGV98615.1 transcription repressor NadR [Ruminococcus sp. AF14-10]GCA68136.1 transcriptional regulator [Mediterraneibacter butyricigenes]